MKKKHLWKPKRLVMGLVVLALALTTAGSYVLSHRHTGQQPAPSAGLLKPVSLGIAPYQYVAYSSSLTDSMRVTGADNLFAAFVIADGGCTPSWGGTAAGDLDGKRAAEIKADITTLRQAGGEAAISFGGASGTDLAAACTASAQLAGAYQQVVSMYGATRLDFDIEGDALSDHGADTRRVEAIRQLRHDNPQLQVWVTLPVQTGGLTGDGRFMLTKLADAGVVLSGVNIMAMNYNAGVADMGGAAAKAAQATVGQLADIYPEERSETLWKTLMITVMAGHNNTPDETFSLRDARTVHDFAAKNGVGTLSVWNVARDMACPPDTPQPSVSCSGVQQQPYAFIKALSIAPRQ